MFEDIASQLVHSNRSKMELQAMDKHGFKIGDADEVYEDACLC